MNGVIYRCCCCYWKRALCVYLTQLNADAEEVNQEENRFCADDSPESDNSNNNNNNSKPDDSIFGCAKKEDDTAAYDYTIA